MTKKILKPKVKFPVKVQKDFRTKPPVRPIRLKNRSVPLRG